MKFPAIATLMLLSAPLAASDFDRARDHDSILAMQGEYTVRFAFDETVVLQPGYERAQAMRSSGNEVIIVLEDTPTRIVLQHVLVDSRTGHVTKHWRQDWQYEAPARFEFGTNQTWHVRPIPAEVTRNAWTQCVYEVSDAPRYCGTGKWQYDNGIATWRSDLTWRPLPRREYSQRDDYNVLLAINQHTITPQGWSHEQFNRKVQQHVDGSQTEIAREVGFNDYRRTTEVDFSPAYRYWKDTAAFWTKVRQHWEPLLAQPPGIRLKTELDTMALIIPLFEQAEAVRLGNPIDEAWIAELLAHYVDYVETATAQ